MTQIPTIKVVRFVYEGGVAAAAVLPKETVFRAVVETRARPFEVDAFAWHTARTILICEVHRRRLFREFVDWCGTDYYKVTK